MIDLVELVSGWIYALRITTWQQWVLRGIILLAGVVIAALCLPWVAAVIAPAWLALFALGVLSTAIVPDSFAPLLTMIPLFLAWSGGGVDAAWWRYAAVAAAVAVFHLAATYAAAAPSFARIRRPRDNQNDLIINPSRGTLEA